MNILLKLISFLLLVSCTHQQLAELPGPTSNEGEKIEMHVPRGTSRINLSWENTTNPHPERAPWSDLLIGVLRANLSTYEAAEDITAICPHFNSLATEAKLKALGELFVATAYHESRFNPLSSSVDVGSQADKGSWSVGLYQMSANDSACKAYKASFESLKDPLVNIKCATEQMRRQIAKTGKVLLPNSSPQRYWAVLLEGNKYSKIPDIKARVLTNSPACK